MSAHAAANSAHVPNTTRQTIAYRSSYKRALLELSDPSCSPLTSLYPASLSSSPAAPRSCVSLRMPLVIAAPPPALGTPDLGSPAHLPHRTTNCPQVRECYLVVRMKRV